MPILLGGGLGLLLLAAVVELAVVGGLRNEPEVDEKENEPLASLSFFSFCSSLLVTEENPDAAVEPKLNPVPVSEDAAVIAEASAAAPVFSTEEEKAKPPPPAVSVTLSPLPLPLPLLPLLVLILLILPPLPLLLLLLLVVMPLLLLDNLSPETLKLPATVPTTAAESAAEGKLNVIRGPLVFSPALSLFSTAPEEGPDTKLSFNFFAISRSCLLRRFR